MLGTKCLNSTKTQVQFSVKKIIRFTNKDKKPRKKFWRKNLKQEKKKADYKLKKIKEQDKCKL